jgi:Spy/CpxP family protein refolding chaperone
MRKTIVPLMLLLAGTPALAQEHGGSTVSPEQRQELFNDEMSQMASTLGLDSAASARFKATLQKYRGQAAPIGKDLHATFQALKQEMASPQPGPNRLTQLADQLTSDRQKLQAIDAQRLSELRQQLTPQQYAQLLLKRRAFGRDMRHQMRALRHAAPQR